MKPLVSAIITTHNRLPLLQRAIESVKQQTYPNIELIVVDDASTDGTCEFCKAQDFVFVHIPKERSRGGNLLAIKELYAQKENTQHSWMTMTRGCQTRLNNRCSLLNRREANLCMGGEGSK